MPPRRRRVLVSYLGLKLDRPGAKWRPTVELCRSAELAVDELILIQPAWPASAAEMTGNVLAASRDAARSRPGEFSTKFVPLQIRDPWSVEEVAQALVRLVESPLKLDPKKFEVFISVTTGTHVIQSALALLVRSGRLPGQLVIYVAPDDPSQVDATAHPQGHIVRLPSRLDEVSVPSLSRPEAGGTGWFFESRNDVLRKAEREIELVAQNSNDPILLLGPTGSGKTVYAKRIHELKTSSGRARGTFVPVNCATLRGPLLASTLFGHKEGVATDVKSARVGALKQADGGVLFLDEIGELPPDTQAQLLKALEEKEFYRVGEDEPTRSDFQLVAATNRPLAEAVEDGLFREDLYSRIKQWQWTMPPLSARREDIPEFVKLELSHLAEPVAFSEQAMQAYLAFATAKATAWPGNLRDLRSSVHRMATRARIEALSASAQDPTISASIVGEEVARLSSEWSTGRGRTSSPARSLVAECLGPAMAKELTRYDLGGFAEVVRVCRTAPFPAEAGRVLFGDVANPADRVAKVLKRYGTSWAEVRDEATLRSGDP